MPKETGKTKSLTRDIGLSYPVGKTECQVIDSASMNSIMSKLILEFKKKVRAYDEKDGERSYKNLQA